MKHTLYENLGERYSVIKHIIKTDKKIGNQLSYIIIHLMNNSDQDLKLNKFNKTDLDHDDLLHKMNIIYDHLFTILIKVIQHTTKIKATYIK